AVRAASMANTPCRRLSNTRARPSGWRANPAGSSNAAVRCGGMARTDSRRTTLAGSATSAVGPVRAAATISALAAARDSMASVRGGLAYRREDVGRLRKDGFFEGGGVGHRRVERRHAQDGRVEELEVVLGDVRRDLGAEAHGQLIFVRDDD